MHLQDLYPKIWLLKRENTLITLQNPVTLILIHRQNKQNSTKTRYTGTSVEDFKISWWPIDLQSTHLVDVDGYSLVDRDSKEASLGRWIVEHLFPAVHIPLICFLPVIFRPNSQFSPANS